MWLIIEARDVPSMLVFSHVVIMELVETSQKDRLFSFLLLNLIFGSRTIHRESEHHEPHSPSASSHHFFQPKNLAFTLSFASSYGEKKENRLPCFFSFFQDDASSPEGKRARNDQSIDP